MAPPLLEWTPSDSSARAVVGRHRRRHRYIDGVLQDGRDGGRCRTVPAPTVEALFGAEAGRDQRGPAWSAGGTAAGGRPQTMDVRRPRAGHSRTGES